MEAEKTFDLRLMLISLISFIIVFSFCTILAKWLWHPSSSDVPALPASTEQAIHLALPKLTEHMLNTSPAQAIEPNSPAIPDHSHWHNVTLKKGESLYTLFKHFGISYDVLQDIEHLSTAKPYLQKLQIGDKLKLLINDKHELLRLEYPVGRFKTLVILKTDNAYQANVEKTPIVTYLRYKQGTVHDALLTAASDAGVSRRLIYQYMRVFQNQVNFRHLRPGTQFTLLYQEHFLKGEDIGSGDIVAATLKVKDKTYTAIHFVDQKGYSSYYTPQGRNLKLTFARFPLKFKRISSSFSLRRWQPILRVYRAHLGVDLAANYGTPIHAVADGTIIRRSRDGGYGRLVIVKHSFKYSTRYAHMSHYAKGQHVGSHVKRGQVIGYVGESGLATGPHVHFEFRIFGVPVDPVKVKLPRAASIAKKDQHVFKAHAKYLLSQLDLHQETSLAVNQLK